jgi:hypothetical protein
MVFLRAVSNCIKKRNFMKSTIRKHEHDDGGIVGKVNFII